MFRRSNNVSLKCPLHNQPVQYICVENHICNPEKNRALCEECLQNHDQSSVINGLEDIEDFLSGDFIYSEMQKTIEALEDKLSETHSERLQKVIEETFENLKTYFINTIDDTKKNILENIRAKRFERHYILTSWKRLQESLENKLEVLTEQSALEKRDLEEYIELFHNFKSKARAEQNFSKLEDEFEKKLFVEDETVKDLKSSLAGTLEGFKKNIWEEAPNLSRLPNLDNPSLSLCDTIKTGSRGFRIGGMKYVQELDKIILADRDFRLLTYDFLCKELKEICTLPGCYAIEYVPKLNRVLLGGKGFIYVRSLTSVVMGEELQEIKLPNPPGTVTSLKYLPEQGLVLCSGLFSNIYCLSVEDNLKLVDTLNTDKYLCSSMIYMRGTGLVAGGLENGYINIYQLKDKKVREVLKGHNQRILTLDYSSTRDILISGSKDASIRVWMNRNDEFNCNRIIRCSENAFGVSHLQFINTSIIMSLHKDLYIRFWDALSGKSVGETQVFQNEGHTAQYVEERGLVVGGDLEVGKIFILKFT